MTYLIVPSLGRHIAQIERCKREFAEAGKAPRFTEPWPIHMDVRPEDVAWLEMHMGYWGALSEALYRAAMINEDLLYESPEPQSGTLGHELQGGTFARAKIAGRARRSRIDQGALPLAWDEA